MKYLPYEKYELEPIISSEEVKKRIENSIGVGKNFKGTFNKDIFKVTRILWYRNDFSPVIEGHIFSRVPSTNKIIIIMRLNKGALVGWIFFMTFSLIIFLLSLYSLILGQNDFSLFYLIPLFMLFFMYLLCIISFNHGAKKSKELLEDVFK